MITEISTLKNGCYTPPAKCNKCRDLIYTDYLNPIYRVEYRKTYGNILICKECFIYLNHYKRKYNTIDRAEFNFIIHIPPLTIHELNLNPETRPLITNISQEGILETDLNTYMIIYNIENQLHNNLTLKTGA